MPRWCGMNQVFVRTLWHVVLLMDAFPCDNRKTTTSIMLLNDTVTEVIEVTASYCSIPSQNARHAQAALHSPSVLSSASNAFFLNLFLNNGLIPSGPTFQIMSVCVW